MSKPSPERLGLCPICNNPAAETYRPFCSKHCADVDLGRWFSGTYAVPAVEDDDEGGADSDGNMLP
jgi:uncharacterized protein